MMIFVFHYTDLKESIAAYEKKFNKILRDEAANFDALTVYPTSKESYVSMLLQENSSNGLLGNIHHECIHVAMHILHERGVVISYDNDEAITYLSTYIFKKICKKLELI